MPRALLITYHFPPSTAAGANRWNAFTRYASAIGWEFDVISSSYPTPSTTHSTGVGLFPVGESAGWIERLGRVAASISRAIKSIYSSPLSASNNDQVSEQTIEASMVKWRISKSAFRQAYSVWVLHARMRSWMKNAIVMGNTLTQQHTYDMIISSGPPHLAHEAARRISSRTGIPFVCDFRDPWAQIDVLQTDVASPLYYLLSRYYERRIVDSARLVCMNTDPAADVMTRTYPEANIIMVRNGFDQAAPVAQHGSTFLTIYAGAVYLDRDPRPLLKAASVAIDHLNLAPVDFQLRFIGPTDSFGGVSIQSLAESYGVGDYVIVSGQMSRSTLMNVMAGAALLINLPQGAKLCIPSKIYEYLHMPAWILAMENAGSATAKLLEETSAYVVPPSDVEAISRILISRIGEYRQGIRPQASVSGDRFLISRQAEIFFREISGLLPSSPHAKLSVNQTVDS